MEIERLDHFVLPVADLAATCAFYAQILGMRVETFGDGRTALRFGRQKINLHEIGNRPDLRADNAVPGSADVCFVTRTPLAEVQEHLRACGVVPVAGPVRREGALGSMSSLYIRDPDGNLVELSNYDRPAGA